MMYIRWLVRAMFAGLLAFELANYVGILHWELEFSWFGLIVTALPVWITLEIITRLLARRGLKDTWLPEAVFLIALTGVMVDALGDIFHWYGQFSWYDQLAHVVGGLTAGGVAYLALTSWLARPGARLSPDWIAFFTLTCVALVGTFYELEEYFKDYLKGVTRRLGDGPDTANDLFLNLVGGLAMIGFMRVWSWLTRQSKK